MRVAQKVATVIYLAAIFLTFGIWCYSDTKSIGMAASIGFATSFILHAFGGFFRDISSASLRPEQLLAQKLLSMRVD